MVCKLCPFNVYCIKWMRSLPGILPLYFYLNTVMISALFYNFTMTSLKSIRTSSIFMTKHANSFSETVNRQIDGFCVKSLVIKISNIIYNQNNCQNKQDLHRLYPVMTMNLFINNSPAYNILYLQPHGNIL